MNGGIASSSSRRAHSAPMPVGPHILWAENATKSASHACTSTARWGTAWQASTSTCAPAACAASASGRMSLMVPSTLDIALTASSLAPSRSAERFERSRLVVGGERDPPDLDAALGGEDLPRHDVGVVLHVREHDGIALTQVGPGPGVRDEVDGLGGVAHVDDLVRVRGVDEARDLGARGLERGGGLLRDRVHAAVHVGVVLAVVAVHRVEHRERLLRRGRGVEVDEALAVHLPLQDREVGLDAGDVERWSHQRSCCTSSLNASKPSASMRRASSGPPVATMRPSSSTCTASGVRWSRMRW